MALLDNEPTGFTATNASSSQIDLSWVNGELLPIEIQRKASGGTYGTIYTTASTDTTYNDTTLSSNTLYYYRIRYKSGDDYSAWVLDNEYTNPAPPTGLAVAWSGKTATMTWTNNDVYTVIWVKVGGVVLTNTLTGTLATYSTTVATENLSYSFQVLGSNSTSTYKSAYCTAVASTSLMLAPTGMTLTSASTTSVTVTWVEPSAVATHYEVWMDGALLADGTIAAGVLTLTESGLTISTTYAFKIRAKLGTVYSLFNTEVEIDTGVAPDQPAVIGAVTVVSSSALTVAWTCTATNETGFRCTAGQPTGQPMR